MGGQNLSIAFAGNFGMDAGFGGEKMSNQAENRVKTPVAMSRLPGMIRFQEDNL